MVILSGDGIHQFHRFDSRMHRGRRVVGWMHDEMRATLEMLIDRFEVKSVIEVGSFLGLSACFFAERVDEVHCIDVWEKNMMGSVMQAAMAQAGAVGEHMDSMHEVFLANTEAYPNIHSYKMDSLTAAETLGLEADLIYLDGDHTYEGITADIQAWRPRAKKVLCGDDNIPKWPTVTEAAKEIGANIDQRVWWLPSS